MARSKLTAAELQEQYGDVLASSPFCDCSNANALYTALAARQPPVEASLGCVRIWWNKYKIPEGGISVASAQDLEQWYGDAIRPLGLEFPAAFKLCRDLRDREPPLCITNKVAEVWLQK